MGLLRKSPYSVKMRKIRTRETQYLDSFYAVAPTSKLHNTAQNNSIPFRILLFKYQFSEIIIFENETKDPKTVKLNVCSVKTCSRISILSCNVSQRNSIFCTNLILCIPLKIRHFCQKPENFPHNLRGKLEVNSKKFFPLVLFLVKLLQWFTLCLFSLWNKIFILPSLSENMQYRLVWWRWHSNPLTW